MLAAIFDCEGPRLNAEEKAFFKDVDPWGFIVFARHCPSADELRAHCDELRECVGRADAPILIDQEGGRVARMKPPVFPAHPAPAVFGELWRLNPGAAKEASRLNAYLLGRMVSDCGVNVNAIPMLDVPQPDANEAVIGDRAYAKFPDTIIELAKAARGGSIEGGALPVIKHMPGHGRALCDSHHELPSVCARKEDLQSVDFAPFKALADTGLGMTGHVVFEAYDKDHCATLSRTIIEDVIRGEIGFDGLLFTDDLRMKALGGAMASRVKDSLDAGCDVALCCNFTMEEKIDGVKGARELSGKALARADAAMGQLQPVDRSDTTDAYEQLKALLKPVLA
ncbi:MAG: glycosyl hydrolase [Hyphococcus sp.]|nr:MAG: glycosyl hydrolase [Marinicaulis sp.]